MSLGFKVTQEGEPSFETIVIDSLEFLVLASWWKYAAQDEMQLPLQSFVFWGIMFYVACQQQKGFASIMVLHGHLLLLLDDSRRLDTHSSKLQYTSKENGSQGGIWIVCFELVDEQRSKWKTRHVEIKYLPHAFFSPSLMHRFLLVHSRWCLPSFWSKPGHAIG